MKSLLDIVDNTKTDKNTVHSYLPLYQELLHKKRDTARNVLELGIYSGGSIKLWNDFFVNADIYGIDIDPDSERVWRDVKFQPRIHLFMSTDGYDAGMIQNRFVNNNIKFDFVLDDGPHTLESQRLFIKRYLPLLTEDGILIIEDVQSSDWIDSLKNEVPDEFKKYVKTYDLRGNKGRYDDIVFTINKSSTL
jgi:predicted O-methyltransferase YrrM